MEISAVRLLDLPDGGELAAARVEGPKAADVGHEGYAFDLRGCVCGRRAPVVAVHVLHGGVTTARVPVDLECPEFERSYPDSPNCNKSGFHGTVNCLRAPPEFDIRLRAVMEDGQRIEFASISGRRRTLRSDYEPAFQPLMVTTIGRSGSSLMLRLLGALPGIVTYRPRQFEPRVGSYWLDVLAELSDPASYRRQLSPPFEPGGRHWWLSNRFPVPQPLPDGEVEEWLGARAPEIFAAFVQKRIDDVYRVVSRAQDRVGDEVYFAEKFFPAHQPWLMWELYPRARELFLVRDFRDVACSWLDFIERHGARATPNDSVDSFVHKLGGSVAGLAESWESRGAWAHLVRYEDLVRAPIETMGAVLDYLSLARAPEALDALAPVIGDRVAQRGHGTTPDAASSIGRWQRDLDAEMRRACEEALGPFLQVFGYSS